VVKLQVSPVVSHHRFQLAENNLTSTEQRAAELKAGKHALVPIFLHTQNKDHGLFDKLSSLTTCHLYHSADFHAAFSPPRTWTPTLPEGVEEEPEQEYVN
jgi:hypothetical protein